MNDMSAMSDSNCKKSEKPVIVVSEQLKEKAMDLLCAEAVVIESTPEDVLDVIGQADGLVVRTYTQVNEELLDRAKKLKVVGRAGVALDNINVPLCRSRGVEVVHTPEANTLAVVDYAIRMIIEMNRKFWPLAGYVAPEKFHEIRKQNFGRFLADMTLGIIGCGRIGSRVGRAAAALGMRVLYNDILDIELDYPAESVDKDYLYANSDVVTIHLPVTDLTRKIINAEALAKFKDGAQLINAARGACVDYAALGASLRNGKIGFAVIDCHDPEPMPEDYPLFGLKNVILTPHTAACVPKAKENMSMVVTDVLKVCNGEAPEFPALEGSY
ncbi:MAG: phosphoglycerate dehydrogenase [Phycisphaerae bacterium]|nr:phosphoglycerate dehydrogenase [Phycisphaerae bacterium]